MFRNAKFYIQTQTQFFTWQHLMFPVQFFFKEFSCFTEYAAFLTMRDQYHWSVNRSLIHLESIKHAKDLGFCYISAAKQRTPSQNRAICQIWRCSAPRLIDKCVLNLKMVLALPPRWYRHNLKNKAWYTANTSCGRGGRGGNARCHTFKLVFTNRPTDRPTNRRTDGQSLL